jgi:hypothetical protein
MFYLKQPNTTNSIKTGMSLIHCNVLIKFNFDLYKPTLNSTVDEIIVKIFTCTKNFQNDCFVQTSQIIIFCNFHLKFC